MSDKNDSIRYFLVKNVLTILNEKFTTHGLRVAYLFLKMCEYEGRKKDLDLRALIELCIFHDIGAFSTEEVKDMLRFETTTTLQHSTYGYLFLKYLSNLGELSEIILYHHLKYEDRDRYQSKFINTSMRIHFVDRVDISMLNFETDEEIVNNLRRLSGTWFHPDDFHLFMKANEEYKIFQKLRDHTYEQELIDFYSLFPYDFKGIIEVLKILVYCIDFRSEQTVIHTISSAATAKYLGKQFHLSNEEQDDLYFGALLHDIGKIRVPLDILESSNRLSQSEMSIMRKHVEETGRIIKSYVSDNIFNIAVRHHEKCNGGGYPFGLQESQLTLSERIVSVSDIFCALVERRSYKNQLDRVEVQAIIQTMADNKEIDRGIVDVVIQEYDNILEQISILSKDIRDRYEYLKRDYLDVMSRNENSLSLGDCKELFSSFGTA